MDLDNRVEVEKKIGIATFITLILFVALITYLIIININSDNYTVKVQFLFVGDLKQGAPVKFIGGLRVGYVKKIYIKDQKIETVLSIRKTFKIRRKADVSIYGNGLLGDKFININQGPKSGEFVKSGATLQGNSALGLEIIQQSLSRLSLALGGKKIDEKKLKQFNVILNQLAHNLRILNFKIYNARPYLKNFFYNGREKMDILNKKVKNIDKRFRFINNLKKLYKNGIPINKILDYLTDLNLSLNDLNNSLSNIKLDEVEVNINDIKNNKNNTYHELIYNDSLYNTLNDILEYTADFSETIAANPYKIFSSK